ncbi:hypothetical protein ASPBRDRAFT_71917 [Aspergillus brasiliensis CBS 101740]|uniref:Uncharacterized protein n=1 Tax=Aspergillus brasiliensis (strain CBS 101740 / IMI 381727 / IBT 21946) TaxID=767769 RepID=A0A1L9UWA7_ASPBC|nr:hypothetical protein ASPBRDRAFT_71917 [Aspergillus brasiliensis CBS 101740]
MSYAFPIRRSTKVPSIAAAYHTGRSASRGEPCHQHHYDNLAIFPPMIVVAVQLVAAGKRSDTLRKARTRPTDRHMRLVTSREDSFPQICPELVQAETLSGTCL